MVSSTLHTISNSPVPLPDNWDEAKTSEGIPYFVDGNNGTTQWNDPRVDARLKKLEVRHIRFNAYRAVVQLRLLQNNTRLSHVHLKNLLEAFHDALLGGRNEATLTISEMQKCLTFAFELSAVSEPRESADRVVHWLLCTFDKKRSSVIKTRDFKIATASLSTSQLEDKFRYIFSILDVDYDGIINPTQMEYYLSCLGKIIDEVSESSKDLDTSGEGIASAVDSCFRATTHYGDNKLSLKEFTLWVLNDQCLVLIVPLLARYIFAEKVTHHVKCAVCSINPIVGLRYRSLKSFGVDICQNCFFEGKESKRHKVNHPMLEYCYPAKNGFSVFKKRVKNINKTFDWELNPDYISATSEMDELIAREQQQARQSQSAHKEKAEVRLEGGLRKLTSTDDEETARQIAIMAALLGKHASDPISVQAFTPPTEKTDNSQQTYFSADESTQTDDFLFNSRPAPGFAGTGEESLQYVEIEALSKKAEQRTPVPQYTAADQASLYAIPVKPNRNTGVRIQESSAMSSDSVVSVEEGTIEGMGVTATGRAMNRTGSVASGRKTSALIDPSELEFLAEQELLAASKDMEDVAAEIARMDNNDEPGFGEQLLQAAREIAESTSLLVSQAKSSDKGWSKSVADKAIEMHAAAQALALNIKKDAEGEHVSEEVLVAAAKSVKIATEDLVKDLDNLELSSPSAKEARNTLKKSRVQFDELVDFAEDAANDEEGGASVSIGQSGALSDEDILTGLRKVGSSFTQRLTLKRQSLQDKAMADRWLRIMFAIEEEAEITVPKINEGNVITELPKRLMNGVLCCHLVRAFLPEHAEELVPAEPHDDQNLSTIRIMENLDKFIAGCNYLGLPEKSLCTVYDIMEGRRPLKVVNCLEAVIALGTQRKK